MPLMFLDRMKSFTVYYPSGNFQNVIEKYQLLASRQANPRTARGMNISKLKKSVNKIMHIR